jgi:hypothetical protein
MCLNAHMIFNLVPIEDCPLYDPHARIYSLICPCIPSLHTCELFIRLSFLWIGSNLYSHQPPNLFFILWSFVPTYRTCQCYYLIESQHTWLCFLQEFYRWKARSCRPTYTDMIVPVSMEFWLNLVTTIASWRLTKTLHEGFDSTKYIKCCCCCCDLWPNFSS